MIEDNFKMEEEKIFYHQIVNELDSGIAEDTYKLELEIQKIIQLLENLNETTSSSVIQRKDNLLNEKQKLEEMLSRERQIGLDYMEQAISARSMIDKSLYYQIHLCSPRWIRD